MILRLHLYGSLYCEDYEIGFQGGINGSVTTNDKKMLSNAQRSEMGEIKLSVNEYIFLSKIRNVGTSSLMKERP